MKINIVTAACCMLSAVMPQSCAFTNESKENTEDYAGLVSRIEEIADKAPGKFGVAVIVDNSDTIVVNNSSDYPMMSMFKLHEAIAVCHVLDEKSIGLDTVFDIVRPELDPQTWSPMLKEHVGENFSLTAGELIDYILIDSDNNASNLLFDEIISVPQTDAYVHSILPGSEFSMQYKESEMKADIMKSYDNRTSPLAYAELVNRLFTDSIVSAQKQAFIKRAMHDCNTGLARRSAGLPENKGIKFSHRTGSGYTNSRGEVIAINDGGYVELPFGKNYTIVVLVKDFAGPQEEAEKVMSEISNAVYEYLVGESADIVKLGTAPDSSPLTLRIYEGEIPGVGICTLSVYGYAHSGDGVFSLTSLNGHRELAAEKGKLYTLRGEDDTTVWECRGEAESTRFYFFLENGGKNIFWAPDDSRCDMTHPMRLVYDGEFAA